VAEIARVSLYEALQRLPGAAGALTPDRVEQRGTQSLLPASEHLPSRRSSSHLLDEISPQALRETLFAWRRGLPPLLISLGALSGRESCKLKAILENVAVSTVEALISAIANSFIVKAPAYDSKT
jgi:hypothetical protein